jgi:hypothetical protein
LTTTSPAFLEENLQLAASSHGQHWTSDTGQPSAPINILVPLTDFSPRKNEGCALS